MEIVEFRLLESANEERLVNTNCLASVLLGYVKRVCGYGDLADAVDLATETGEVVDLVGRGRGEYAKKYLEPRASYILVRVVGDAEDDGGAGGGALTYLPLLDGIGAGGAGAGQGPAGTAGQPGTSGATGGGAGTASVGLPLKFAGETPTSSFRLNSAFAVLNPTQRQKPAKAKGPVVTKGGNAPGGASGAATEGATVPGTKRADGAGGAAEVDAAREPQPTKRQGLSVKVVGGGSTEELASTKNPAKPAAPNQDAKPAGTNGASSLTATHGQGKQKKAGK
ncbi:hypothetical protein HK405_003265 [Cladochytrium tenue]|nr:hypothetical protein HK405_003265 [Cladochytrium tenue]